MIFTLHKNFIHYLIVILSILSLNILADDVPSCENKFTGPLSCYSTLKSLDANNLFTFRRRPDPLTMIIEKLSSTQEDISLITFPGHRDGYRGFYIMHNHGITWKAISSSPMKIDQMVKYFKINYPKNSKTIYVFYSEWPGKDNKEIQQIAFNYLSENAEKDFDGQEIFLSDVIDDSTWSDFAKSFDEYTSSLLEKSTISVGPNGSNEDIFPKLIKQCLDNLNPKCESNRPLIKSLQNALDNFHKRQDQLIKAYHRSIQPIPSSVIIK